MDIELIEDLQILIIEGEDYFVHILSEDNVIATNNSLQFFFEVATNNSLQFFSEPAAPIAIVKNETS